MNAAPSTLALWSPSLADAPRSLDDWIDRVDAKLARCADEGADLLIMPELTAMAWLGYGPKMALTEHCAWLADRAAVAIPRLRARAVERGVSLVPGSTPYRHERDGRLVNRAFFLAADGAVHHHDKLALTPTESQPDAWCLEGGDALRVFHWRGLRVAMLICLDAQLTRAAARLSAHRVDLLIVPAGTRELAGHHRVFDCAKARAIELQCPVAAVGLLGPIGKERYVGGTAVYLPCEPSLDHTGVLHQSGPIAPDTADDPFVVVRDVPFAHCRTIRRGDAQAYSIPARWLDSAVRDSIRSMMPVIGR